MASTPNTQPDNLKPLSSFEVEGKRFTITTDKTLAGSVWNIRDSDGEPWYCADVYLSPIVGKLLIEALFEGIKIGRELQRRALADVGRNLLK